MAIMFSKMVKSVSRNRENEIYADLHIHSKASDGEYTPSQIAGMLNSFGIMVGALSDHDTFAGYSEFASRFNGIAVPGVELSVSCCNTGIHLLGYGFDPTNRDFIKKLEYYQKIRGRRIEKMCLKLQKLGFQVSIEDVRELSEDGATLGRPHIARALLAKKYIRNFNEAFVKLIGDDGPAYVHKEKMTIEEGITAIRNAGGIAVIAHPGLYRQNEITFDDLINQNVDGYEAFHPQHTGQYPDSIIQE